MDQAVVDIVRCEAASFTVDLSGPIDVAVVGNAAAFFEPTGLSFLQQNDNVILRSMWIVLPYCFCTSQPQFVLQVGGRDNALLQFDLRSFATDDRQFVPVENCETALDVFIPFSESPNGLPWEFFGLVDTGRISMQNVPAALDTEELTIYAYLKIAHNLPLI